MYAGIEGVAAHRVVDPAHLACEDARSAPLVAPVGEIGTNVAAEIGLRRRQTRDGRTRLKNTYTPGWRGKWLVSLSLANPLVPVLTGELHQVIEGQHAKRPGPLEQSVQDLPGGGGVVQGPVGRSSTVRKNPARVDNLQSGTSSATSRRARRQVSMTRLAGLG